MMICYVANNMTDVIDLFEIIKEEMKN